MDTQLPVTFKRRRQTTQADQTAQTAQTDQTDQTDVDMEESEHAAARMFIFVSLFFFF